MDSHTFVSKIIKYKTIIKQSVIIMVGSVYISHQNIENSKKPCFDYLF